MKEAVSKIIERLEGEVCYQQKCHDSVKGFNRTTITQARQKMKECYEHAIEIVKEVAEEYSHRNHDLDIESSHSNEWVTLPKVAFDRLIARMESESERDLEEEPSWFINVNDATRIVFEIASEYSDSKIPNLSEKLTCSDGKDTNVRSNIYNILLIGCDDTTEFEMSLTDQEYKLLQKVSEISEGTSSYQCMPVMSVEQKGKSNEHDK